MQQLFDLKLAIAVCFETTMMRKHSHSIVTSPSSHRKNQKSEIEQLLLQQKRENVKIENHDLHHQLQQEVETALHSKSGDYDERSEE